MTDKPLIIIGRGTFRISDDTPNLPPWIYTSMARIAKWLNREMGGRSAKDWSAPTTTRSTGVQR